MTLGFTEIKIMASEVNEHLKTQFKSSAPKTRAIEGLCTHLDNFLKHYDQLDGSQLDQLEHMYTQDVLFIDPLHEIKGLMALKAYFSKLYQNIDSLEFNFGERFFSDAQVSVYWEMRFKHRRINSGEQVSVPGNSRLSFDVSGKVSEHRDYFDSAAMLYRQLPILKQVISLIDGRLA